MNLLYFALLLITAVFADTSLDPLSDEFIDSLNEQDLPWRAGRNFDPSMSLDDIKRLLGVKSDNHIRTKLALRISSGTDGNDKIPNSFDSRDAWPNCSSIRIIRDQSHCGSCWAFAAVEAMSDRICIHSGQENQTLVSANDLLACCSKCGDGCDGGYPAAAWEFWSTEGIVTGGLFNKTDQGCQSYPLPPCGHHTNETLYGNCSKLDNFVTPNCTKTCDLDSSNYTSEKTYGQKPYGISSLESDIQLEIMKNGPVEASFDVFDDFFHYQSGIYRRSVNATAAGSHAVKIIGWGVESNLSYWLIANSWDTNWGENGYFRMLRGENECGIESYIVAGLPVIHSDPEPSGATNVVPYFQKFVLSVIIGMLFLIFNA